MRRSASRVLAICMLLGGVTAAGIAQGADGWTGTPQEAFLNGPIVAKFQCTTCHTITDDGGTVGPILNRVGARRTQDWLRRWLKDPQSVKPNTKMPKFDFTPEEFELLISSLTRMTTPVHADAILSGPGTPVEKGEELFRALDCRACHRLGKEGRFVGPDLTWLGLRKTRDWEQVWLKDPPAFKPDTFMPNFHLSAPEITALSAYLETLRGQANSEAQSWEFMVNMFLNNKAPRRGEFVFKRLACWGCHGEQGKGGVRNPNAAPHEVMPPLTKVTLDYTPEELRKRLSRKHEVAPLHASAPPPPFFCPDYSEAIVPDEFEDLYAYLQTLAPKKSKWKVR
ncbi:MAG: c-type cytochrome [Acidobacteriota bacterium]